MVLSTRVDKLFIFKFPRCRWNMWSMKATVHLDSEHLSFIPVRTTSHSLIGVRMRSSRNLNAYSTCHITTFQAYVKVKRRGVIPSNWNISSPLSKQTDLLTLSQTWIISSHVAINSKCLRWAWKKISSPWWVLHSKFRDFYWTLH